MTATNSDAAGNDGEKSAAQGQGAAYGREALSVMSPLHRDLKAVIPNVYAGFAELSKAAMADGALDRKTKELIALAIAVVKGCDGCIASHARGAARTGASRQEAAEAIGVTVLMNGGPGTTYGARAYDAFCEFADMYEARAT